MRELQRLLDSLNEDLYAASEQRRTQQIEGEDGRVIEDKAYYYYLGKEVGARKAVRLVEYHIRHKKARAS